MSKARLMVFLIAACPAATPAAEKWADHKLPVTAGLELWLDASRPAATGPLEPVRSSNAGRTPPGTAGTCDRPTPPPDRPALGSATPGRSGSTARTTTSASPARPHSRRLHRLPRRRPARQPRRLPRLFALPTPRTGATTRAGFTHRPGAVAHARGSPPQRRGPRVRRWHEPAEARPARSAALHSPRTWSMPTAKAVRLIVDGKPNGERPFGPGAAAARRDHRRGPLLHERPRPAGGPRVLPRRHRRGAGLRPRARRADEAKQVREYLDAKYADAEAAPAARRRRPAARRSCRSPTRRRCRCSSPGSPSANCRST